MRCNTRDKKRKVRVGLSFTKLDLDGVILVELAISVPGLQSVPDLVHEDEDHEAEDDLGDIDHDGH